MRGDWMEGQWCEGSFLARKVVYRVRLAGYLNFTDAIGSKHYHYWLVESENDPSTDPLVLWCVPGCGPVIGRNSDALYTLRGTFAAE